ncbi:MAG: hypothetical protein WCP29_03000 [Acidobacteriota bacterium]
MLQELAAETGASVWAIGSMMFFLLAWLGIAAWVYRTRPDEFDARARLPLEGDTEEWQKVPSATPTGR